VLKECRGAFEHFENVYLLVLLKLAASIKKFLDIGFDEAIFIIVKLFLSWWTENLLHFHDLDALCVSWEHWCFHQ